MMTTLRNSPLQRALAAGISLYFTCQATASRIVVLAVLFTTLAGCSSDDAAAGHDVTRGDTAHAKDKPTDQHTEDANRVTLSDAAYQTAEIRVEPVRAADPAVVGEDLEVPGQVEYDPRRVALISSRVAGRIERLTVIEGDHVRAGQTVALLFSPTYVTAQTDLRQAARRAELLAGTADEPGARALAEAARRRLRLLGVDEREITRIEAGGEPEDYLAISAPFAGSIVEAHVLTGAAVDAGQQIFKLADLSVVDVVAEVPERSLPLVSIGQTASISIAAYPSMHFGGRVERLRGGLNPETRTIQAVIDVANPAARLRPGMFATVRLTVPARAVARTADSAPRPATALLTIPESAVVSEGERRYVFVEVGPRTFERREVAVRSLAPPGSTTPAADLVVVHRGLAVEERVVVNGAFTLKSELAKTGLGEHGH
jgi:multidrug efflux pump subunit AcrA (membrane-fusion protein)